MRYLWIILLTAGFMAAGCGKKGEPVTEEMIDEALQAIDMGQVPDFKNWRMKVTDSGIEYVDLKHGDGDMPKDGDRVMVHYHLWLSNGRRVDSSLMQDLPEPFTFIVGEGQVIKGWDEIIRTMRIGGKRLVVIPSKLGYGSSGRGPIPPNAPLTFYINLISVD